MLLQVSASAFLMASVHQMRVLVSSLICRVKMPQLMLSNNMPLNTNQD